jgi:hypothetical protein
VSEGGEDVAPDPGGRQQSRELAANRVPVELPPASRDLIEGRLEDLLLDRDALRLGMVQFGDDFALDRFREAFDSREAAERNRARLVTSNFQAIADGMVELVREAVTAIGLRPAGRRPEANPDIEAIRADEGITGRQAAELVQLKKLANDIRHVYITVSADDVHAGVDRLLKLLPRFTSAYVAWLEGHGVMLPTPATVDHTRARKRVPSDR